MLAHAAVLIGRRRRAFEPCDADLSQAFGVGHDMRKTDGHKVERIEELADGDLVADGPLAHEPVRYWAGSPIGCRASMSGDRMHTFPSAWPRLTEKERAMDAGPDQRRRSAIGRRGVRDGRCLKPRALRCQRLDALHPADVTGPPG